MLFNVSIDCGLSGAHVYGCGLLWLPKAICYCISHAWRMSQYKFDYSPKFWSCLKKLHIERVVKE